MVELWFEEIFAILQQQEVIKSPAKHDDTDKLMGGVNV